MESIFARFPQNINVTEGSVSFKLSDHNLFSCEPALIDSRTIGDVDFLLQKEPGDKLLFQHISPAFGTRVSRVDLELVPRAKAHLIVFTWSPKEVRLYIGVPGRNPVIGDYQKLT